MRTVGTTTTARVKGYFLRVGCGFYSKGCAFYSYGSHHRLVIFSRVLTAKKCYFQEGCKDEFSLNSGVLRPVIPGAPQVFN